MSFNPSHKNSFNFEEYKLNNVIKENEQLNNDYAEQDFNQLFMKILEEGMHGICFSMYEDNQKPGDIIAPDQVRKRLAVLKPYIKWVRSFSCIEGNEWVPRIAKEMGIKTLVGAWLGKDEDLNEKEIENLIILAKEGVVDIAAVGNEVLYRNDISEEKLMQYIKRVKEALPNIPVGYVDAYYEFTVHPDLTAACDVILTNCYPFWEGTPFEYALPHMQQMFEQVLNVANGKKVIITETGWPSQGQSVNGSIPSHLNSLKYFINTQLWAKAAGIENFYFSSFDEAWKIGNEGDVGAYWGLWDKNGNLKFGTIH